MRAPSIVVSVPILAAAGTTAAASETVEPATAACFEFGAGSW